MGSNGMSFHSMSEESMLQYSVGDYVLVKNCNEYKVLQLIEIDREMMFVTDDVFVTAINVKTKGTYKIQLGRYKDTIITKVDKKFKINKKSLDLLYS